MEFCGTNVAELYSLFGDGEGRGYTVCTSVDICQSNQWNSAARMSQNFHHTLYISDYNVSPMEFCGTNVTEFPSYIVLYSLFGDGEGRGYTVCMSVDICQSNQWNSAARMSQHFHHTLYISDYNVSPMEFCGTNFAEFPLYSLFGDGEGQGYTVRLSFDVCQSHHQESAAGMPQIFDHRSMSVSHTTRNLRHVCR